MEVGSLSPGRGFPWLHRRVLPAVFCLVQAAAALAGGSPSENPLAPPDPSTLAEARAIVARMQASDRGPYKRLRWFCKDGTVHPPKPYPCAERGGGHQHAEYSEERQRLAELGWSVGTILTDTPVETLFDGQRRNRLLRELPIERWLVEVEDGWVLRKARFYRGSVQVEDEEEFGRLLLENLLTRTEWVDEEFLLVRELVRALPHRGGGDRIRTVRRLAKEVAELDPSFEPMRIKIHTRPEVADLGQVRAWLQDAQARSHAAAALDKARKLVSEMEVLFGPKARRERLQATARTLATHPGSAPLAALLDGVLDRPASQRLEQLSRFLAAVRTAVTEGGAGKQNLALLGASLDAEAELLVAAGEAAGPTATRRDLLERTQSLVMAAWGTGWLTDGERSDLQGRIETLRTQDSVPLAQWLPHLRALERAPTWAMGTLRWTFGRPLVWYSALEPAAARFPDELLRSSPMMPLASVVGALLRDAEARAGIESVVLGENRAGVVALNPGVARGALRIVREEELASGARLGENEIVVLPRTMSELTPVAGILTFDEGNLLSHVQLLARNLGIPNASLGPTNEALLRRLDGREVVYVVGRSGSLWIGPAAELPEGALPSRASVAATEKVEPPRPDLSIRQPLPLEELGRELSGRVVGPKAANLGELHRKFPGRVAPAVALPFGFYAEHAGIGDGSPRARIAAVVDRQEAGEATWEEVLAEAERVRAQVGSLKLSPSAVEDLQRVCRSVFGEPGTYGAFVRSDTNVEDLPGFTGAGLNETLPHVVGWENLLAAVPRVWASPFRSRAFSWRARALSSPAEVYPSVLLMRSVPADKSGVLVTTDLVSGSEGLTVAMAWGVGGAVDGESAETLVLRPDGGVILVAEAKAPWKRLLDPGGGIEWTQAPMGPVLSAQELAQLRELAREVDEKLSPATDAEGRPLPWDIELGFQDGRLQLFQIRPLVEKGTERADQLLRTLGVRDPNLGGDVDLQQAPKPAGGSS